MITCINHINQLPWFYARDYDRAQDDWLPMCAAAVDVAAKAVVELVQTARRVAGNDLLPSLECDERYWAKPSPMLGSFILMPGDDFAAKTGRPPAAELRKMSSRGYCANMELEFALHRVWARPEFGPDIGMPADVGMTLHFHYGPALDALRAIYCDYRGLFRKLLEPTKLEFQTSSAVIHEMQHIKTRRPIPNLDAALHLKAATADEQWFMLTYKWTSDTGLADGEEAFLILAVIFTAVENLVRRDRASTDDLLRFWLRLRERAKQPRYKAKRTSSNQDLERAAASRP